AAVGIQFRLSFVRGNLILELRNLLSGIRQRVRFSIESFHAMTAHAAALIEEILAQIECVRALGYAIVCMAHLASRFGVLFMKQRVQPEWILAMRFHDAGRGAAVTAVTSRTAELLRIVNLQEFFAGMTDKSVRRIVQLPLARAGGRHIGRVYCERLTRPQVTNLATVYDRKLVDFDLMAENCVVERVLVVPYPIV